MKSLVAIVALAAAAGVAGAEESARVELKAGDQAPAFSLVGSDGRKHDLADMKGKTVILAWFPKAFTGG